MTATTRASPARIVAFRFSLVIDRAMRSASSASRAARSGSVAAIAWSRPPAEHAAIAVAVLWLLLPCVLAATSGLIVISLFIVAPLIAATAADERRTAIIAGATVVLTIAAGWWHGPIEDPNWIRLTARQAGSAILEGAAATG